VLRVVEEKLGDVSYAAGHSLGEFSAHVAAGTLEFAEAVRAVRRRGELMFESGTERPGTMAAVLGLDDAAVERVCAEVSAAADGVVVPANFNSPGQVVISGDVGAVERAMEALKAAGAKRALRLNVSGAFHSPLMEVAKAGLREHLATVDFHAPRFPVVSNVTAEPVDDTEIARRLLVEQLTSPVRWTASMQNLVGLGVTRFVELGNGSVLAGLLKRIDKAARAVSVADPAQVGALDSL
jgi:[acyl-carrier-protein] S-malonyltransferase